jgi:hypothetical protein
MNFALKLPATAGDITKFDCTGGEPNDQHRTIAEQDPADPAMVGTLDGSIADFLNAHAIDLTSPLGDFLNHLLAHALPDIEVPIFGKARIQVRKMDSDGKA